MVAFTADDPTDRAAFDEHMERVLANRGADHWAMTDGDGTLVGTIATFPSDEGPGNHLLDFCYSPDVARACDKLVPRAPEPVRRRAYDICLVVDIASMA